MLCPSCKKRETSIVSDKYNKKTNTIERKRYCICGNLFATYEKFASSRKKRKARADTIWKNTRFIYYADQRITVAHVALIRAINKIFNLKLTKIEGLDLSNYDNYKNKLNQTEIEFFSSKGKSYFTIRKYNSKKIHKYKIQGKKQSIRYLLKKNAYWAHREAVYGNVWDFKAPFVPIIKTSVKKPSSIKNIIASTKNVKLERDIFNKDLVRKEIDEFYKSVCSYIKDKEYNQDFFIKNDSHFKDYWENDFWWNIFTEIR